MMVARGWSHGGDGNEVVMWVMDLWWSRLWHWGAAVVVVLEVVAACGGECKAILSVKALVLTTCVGEIRQLVNIILKEEFVGPSIEVPDDGRLSTNWLVFPRNNLGFCGMIIPRVIVVKVKMFHLSFMLPPPPPYELFPTYNSPSVDFVKATPDPSPRPVEGAVNPVDARPIPDLNGTPILDGLVDKKMKSKKKRLVAGGDLNSQVTSTLNENADLLNEEEVVKNIGAHISSVGAFGGILTMWDSRVFSIEYKVIDKNFMAVVGSWSGMCYQFLNAIWIHFGDFNVVKSQDKCLGSSFDVIEANSFNDFIARVGLFDFPLGGRRFTSFDKNGKSANKLDRSMVSNNFFDFWTDVDVSVLCRSLFDHCHIALKASHGSTFTTDLALKNKLKPLRQEIKAWTSNQIEAQNNLKDDLFRQILDGNLITNEVIRMAFIKDLKLLLFKVDFEKEFDSVNWNFLLDIMRTDKWIWTGDALGKFKVSSLTKSIQNFALGDSVVGYHHFWNLWIPQKVNICVWRYSLNRLPTRSNLVRRDPEEYEDEETKDGRADYPMDGEDDGDDDDGERLARCTASAACPSPPPVPLPLLLSSRCPTQIQTL
nr:hypothetical protein [Tanacetum cinerariifolium]